MFKDWGEVRNYARYCAATFTRDNDMINDYAHDALVWLVRKDLNTIYKRYVFLHVRSAVYNYYAKYLSFQQDHVRVKVRFEEFKPRKCRYFQQDLDLMMDIRDKIKEIRERKDTSTVHRTMLMLLDGMTQEEIIKETGYGSLSYTREKLRMEFNSPFNGSKVKPKQRITRKTYESNPKYKEEFEYNPERGDCDKNESFMQLIHKERDEYLLVVENK